MSFSIGTSGLDAALRGRLAGALDAAPRTEVGDGPWIAGPLLAPTLIRPQGPDPAVYFEAAARWRDVLGPLLEETLEPLHVALAARLGGPVRVPPGHASFTIRVFPPGTASPRHTDNYRGIAAYADLRRLTRDGGQISWFVPLAPYEGGALEVPERGEPVSPAPGDLVVFDGSRLRHRVAEVEGAAPRLTLGGFAAEAADGRGFYAWS